MARLAIDRANEQRAAAILRLRADTSRLGTLANQRHGPLGASLPHFPHQPFHTHAPSPTLRVRPHLRACAGPSADAAFLTAAAQSSVISVNLSHL